MEKLEQHHILEIITTKDGKDGDYGQVIINTPEHLKKLGLYGEPWKENYGLPSWMICKCTTVEHKHLHLKFDKERRKKLSDSVKKSWKKRNGQPALIGKTRSTFGSKFKEHFGIPYIANKSLYFKERSFFKYHGYCSWEVSQCQK